MNQPRLRRTVRWQRLDRPGMERATLSPMKGAWNVDARIETDFGGGPSRIRAHIRCDGSWQTRAAWTTIHQGLSRRRLELFVTEDKGWVINGEERADLRGCVDVDLEISPATNTLPIRRLALDVGEGRDLSVTWIRFPDLRAERARQRYTRTADRRYRFEGLDSGTTVELLVDDAGLVIEYPGLWARAPNP